MNPFGIYEIVRALAALMKHDPDAGRALIDWGLVLAEREMEREGARKRGQRPELPQFFPREVGFGAKVLRCSFCEITPKGTKCVACGNLGRMRKRKP